MPKLLRQIVLFGAPILVGTINLAHPVVSAYPNVYHALLHQGGWWLALHFLNLAAFPLLGLAAYLLTEDWHGLATTVSRGSIAAFIPLYAAFDAMVGIGTGTLVQSARSLPAPQLAVVEPIIQAYWASGTANALATLGSVAWGIGLLAAAVAITPEGRRMAVTALAVAGFALVGWGVATGSSGTLLWWGAVGVVAVAVLALNRWRPAAALLALAAMLFGTTHVIPYGPLGAACFLAAALWLQLSRRSVADAEEQGVAQAGAASSS
ncbi:MAG: hypothetical protein IMW90_20255 [Thermogemmatispora sp.]|uniref:hypothetical protein n=1 Tax=Thermogemmatispora sp. TaxID=1968838 RepID=UPI0019F9554D|nr:hypothetical protein [Thermogemmatispora sp.]MBE3568056.1 hypothetical protein [Thermogemmatispora sp.]